MQAKPSIELRCESSGVKLEVGFDRWSLMVCSVYGKRREWETPGMGNAGHQPSGNCLG
ncbi:hypothetical protein Pla52o_41010 [Novipirellula galeiformis]|uniref:Uncharacterized protein n=1 Tax=Novipirellula galeiformis TaxID=2528004 RepID=A0A5C6CE33_9BACT|nr:hypothetical protein Pla52o_41010 [Novipirellula galeiformis]